LANSFSGTHKSKIICSADWQIKLRRLSKNIPFCNKNRISLKSCYKNKTNFLTYQGKNQGRSTVVLSMFYYYVKSKGIKTAGLFWALFGKAKANFFL